MRTFLSGLIVSLSLLLQTGLVFAAADNESAKFYNKGLCKHPDFFCIKIKKSQSWQRAFPDERQRDLVQRVNRTYNYLHAGKIIAVPKNIESVGLLDVSPFPLQIKKEGERQVIVDQNKLAWAAYNGDGQLIKWGPVSSGKDFCADIGQGCRTITGEFRVFSEQDSRCRSRTFDNARMPYCMFFHKGFAMHGSNDIPGKRASHGCVRMFSRDAKWLNLEFVEAGNRGNDYKGTKVIVRELITKSNSKKRQNYVY